jgi:hypothetical protein
VGLVQLVIDALDSEGDIFANVLYPIVDILNLVVNTLHVVADILHLPLDALNSIIHPHDFAIDALSHLQQLRRCYPCFFLRQFVQPLQAILDVSVPRQLLQVLFYLTCQSRRVYRREINSLNGPRFTSFVAMARIVSTSAIISTIMSVIATVGVRTVYISSRRKKCSMRLKTSAILSWLVLASLAAWEPRCQNSLRKRRMKDTDQEENADPRKDCICRWECLKACVKAEILRDKISRYTLAQHPGQQLRKAHTEH